MKYHHLINYIVVVLFFLDFSARAALPEVPEDSQVAQLWKTKREATIRELQTKPELEMIPELGEMLRQLKMLRYRDCSERDYITAEAQAALLAIPGHAEYYTKQFEIERDKAEAENARRAKDGIGPYWDSYDQVRLNGFDTLAQLPSPETVRVLGEMLYDDRDHQSQEFRRANKELSRSFGESCGAAAGALSRLRIVISNDAKPSKEVVYRPVEFWRVWYEQVKAGTRTFHFEGDPREYNLQGPVNLAKTPVTGRPGRRENSSDKLPEANKPGWFPVMGMLAGGVLLATSVWYFVRKRSRLEP